MLSLRVEDFRDELAWIYSFDFFDEELSAIELRCYPIVFTMFELAPPRAFCFDLKFAMKDVPDVVGYGLRSLIGDFMPALLFIIFSTLAFYPSIVV